MTAVAATEAPPRTTVQRVADALDWTAGQVWTVAIGLAVAVPAAVFGLGPALDDVESPALASAAPPAAASPPTATAPAAAPAPPSILGGGGPSPTPPAGTTSGGPAASSGDAPAADVVVPTVPPAASSRLATIDGAGVVRAVAVAADAVVVTVDGGADAPGRAVVVDLAGEVVLDQPLGADGVTYRAPAGVAVSEQGVFVATADPPAIVRLDVASESVSKVADLPDVPLCLPLAPGPDCQTALPDGGPRPEHLAIGDDGALYVADRGQACVLRVAPGEATATTWLCDLTFVASPTAADGGLTGLAVAGGRLVVTVASAIDGTDRVEEVAIVDGAPGARRELAAPAAGSGTSGAAVLPDGRVVVALTAADELLVIAADGASSNTVPLTDATGPVDLDLTPDALVIAHRTDGAAGAVSRQSLPS